MAVDRKNTIQILYSTADTAPASVSGLNLGKGELAWVDHNSTPGDGGANGRLYIGDGTTAAAVPRHIGGVGTGAVAAAAAAGSLTGNTLASGVTASSLTSLGTQGEALDMGDYAIQNVGDIDADSISVADAAVGLNIDFSGANTGLSAITIKDNVAEALVITQGGNDYLDICTTDSSETMHIGHGVADTAITIGNASSETTVADNLTVAGNLTVSGTPPTWNQNTTGTAAGLSGTPNISCGTIAGSTGTFTGDVSIAGDLTLTGDQTEISTTVIAAEDKEMYLSVPSGLKKGTWTQSGTTVTMTMESAHGLTASTAYDLLITGSSNTTSIPDNVYSCTMHASTGTIFTFTSPVSATVSGTNTAYAAQAASTDTTANGAGIFVPSTSSLGIQSISYQGSSDGWTTTGNATFEDGNYTVDIASHDLANYGLALAGTLVTASAAEINKLDGFTGDATDLNYAKTLYDTGVSGTEFDYLDGVTSNIQTQLDAKGTSNLAIGTTGSTAMAGNLGLTNNAADTMAASGAALTISDTNTTGSDSTGGKLVLQMDDGVATADNHRLGVIEFKGAEDGSNTVSTGARIEAIARDGWGANDNDADLVFYTTDGTTESAALTLDADNDATFTGHINLAAKNIVMTPSADDTITFAASAGGALTITTVDTAAHAADVAWVIDGSMSWAADSGMDLSSSGVITEATLAGGTF